MDPKNNNNRMKASERSIQQPWRISPGLILMIGTGMLVSSWGYAADKTSDSSLQDQLIQKIAERDQVIADLQRRVQLLEQRAAAPEANRPAAASTSPAATLAKSPANQAQVQKAPVKTQQASAVPGSFEIDEDAAQRALERTLVQTGALLLPFGQVDIQPFATYTRREDDTPYLARTSIGGSVANQRIRRDEIDAGANILVGLPFESQFEVRVPGRFINADATFSAPGVFPSNTKASSSAFGDVSVGLAKTLMHETDWLPDVIGRVTWDSATGDIQDNNILTGIGFNDFTGSLTFLKRQDPLAFTGRVAYKTFLKAEGIEPGDQVEFDVNATLAASPQTSLSIGLKQTFFQEIKLNNIKMPGSDGVASMFTAGASSIIGRNLVFIVSGGVGLTEESPDYSLNVTIPIRFDVPRPKI